MAGYDLAAMERAVQQCDRNIVVFREAIAKEEATRIEYVKIVTELKRKAQTEALSIVARGVRSK